MMHPRGTEVVPIECDRYTAIALNAASSIGYSSSDAKCRIRSSAASSCGVIGIAARATSAASSIGGNAFPRLAARRRIPAHDFGESQYFGGIDASGSSTEDKDAATALWRPEELTVQYAPRGDSGRPRCHTCGLPSVRGNRDGGSHEG